ncbi:MAG: hypothetical protein LC778_01075 [Acidobacteria bacterium]|nr:hypothetical protein [Acidobacteriota bacterium]
MIEADPTIRVRLLRSLGKSASQVASVLRNEFNLSTEEVASLLANDLAPYSAADIDLAIRGVYQPAVIPDTTKVSDEVTRNALSSFDSTTGRMTFSAKTPLLGTVEPGDVLVGEPSAAAPYGYLRKVTSIRKEQGSLVLETTQARLDEALQQGTLDAEGILQPSDLLGTEAKVPGVTFSAISAPSDTPQAASVIGDGYNFETAVDVTLEGSASGGGVTGSGKVRIQGYIRFNAGYDVGVGVETCAEIPPVCVDRFEARLGVDQYSRLQVDGQFDGTLNKEIKLATHYFKPVVFFIGPIPVVLVPVVDVVVGVNGDAHLKFSFTSTLTAQLALGAKWTDPDDGGKGWEDVSKKNGVQWTIPEASVDANMHLRAYGKGDAKLLLYGIAGPGFAARIGGGLDAQFPRRPLWRIFGYIGASVNFQVDLGGVLKLSEYSKTVLDEEFTILDAPNQAPRFSNVVTNIIQANVGTPVTLGPRSGFTGYFDCMDPEGEQITYTATSNINGPLNSLTVNFQTPGLRTITVTARDPVGASSSITLKVDVRNSLPIVSISAASATVPATVQYFVTATAYDPDTGAFLGCNSLNWRVISPDTLTLTGSGGTCGATVIFRQEGVRTLTVTATDPHGGQGTSSISVNVTPVPQNRPPVINYFSVQAFRGPFSHICPDPNYLCEAPNNAILFNGQAGDYYPPLYLYLSASDPEGAPITVQWFCKTGTQQAPVTWDYTYGYPSCNPIYSSVEPIKVYAIVSDGVNQVPSEVRTYTMLQRVN